MKLYNDIKAKYFQWRHGMDQAQWDYKQWNEAHICQRANDVTNYFQGFKHVIPVSYLRVNTILEPMFGMHVPGPEIKEYTWPNKEVGQHAMLGHFRGFWDKWDGRFHISDIGGDVDQVFVATNNDEDAFMIALRFS